jgi:hypothetical protein
VRRPWRDEVGKNPLKGLRDLKLVHKNIEEKIALREYLKYARLEKAWQSQLPRDKVDSINFRYGHSTEFGKIPSNPISIPSNPVEARLPPRESGMEVLRESQTISAIGLRLGVSKGVEDGHRTPDLQLGQP